MSLRNENATRETLARYSTCLISDALLKLKQPCGGFLPGISLWSPERQQGNTRLVGPAYTVRFVHNSQTNEPVLKHHYIDVVPKNGVIFISAPKGIPHAVWGGLMCRRAIACGARGTVIDGNLRDLDEQRHLGYPVFARDVSTTAYHEVARISETNVPLRLHDDEMNVIINPGDLIVGDLNGVVCIPQTLVAQVTGMLPGMEDIEKRIEEDIAQGVDFVDASRKHRGS